MTATYEASLPTDKDWVRLLIPDRDVDSDSPSAQGRGPRFSDEEIEAVLAVESNKYFAAARLADVIIGEGRGAVSKSVADLSITYGDSPESAYRSYIKGLREEGARILLGQNGKSAILRAI